MSVSDAWPSNPADGWWITIRQLRSEKRSRFAPPVSSELIDMAIPQQSSARRA